MHALEQVRSKLKAHPLLVVCVFLAIIPFSLGVALALAALVIVVMAWPAVERAMPVEARASLAIQSRQQQTLRVVQEVSAVQADAILLDRAAERERLQSEQWGARAKKAVLASRDEEARRCLERKRHHDDARARILSELEKQKATAEALRPQVDSMRRETREAIRDGEMLAVRARRAQAKKTVVLTASGLASESGQAAFERFAVDVARQEAEADALADILGHDFGADQHEGAWAKAERDASIEEELEELRRKVNQRAPVLTAKGRV